MHFLGMASFTGNPVMPYTEMFALTCVVLSAYIHHWRQSLVETFGPNALNPRSLYLVCISGQTIAVSSFMALFHLLVQCIAMYTLFVFLLNVVHLINFVIDQQNVFGMVDVSFYTSAPGKNHLA